MVISVVNTRKKAAKQTRDSLQQELHRMGVVT
jgi:hypothetical protein